MEEIFKKKESELDLMMELERLKELKFLEEKEKNKKERRYEGKKIIIDQIKEKELKRLMDKEQIIKDYFRK